MKLLLAVYTICIFCFSNAANAQTTDDFVEKLVTDFETALLTTPNCVAKNCLLVNSVDCNQLPEMGLQFTNHVMQGVISCRTNDNGVCGNSMRRINIRDLVLRVSDSPLVTCYGNNDDSYIYNTDLTLVNVLENGVNSRNVSQRWFNMAWPNIQYRGSFDCYGCAQADCINILGLISPAFKMQLQIDIQVLAGSGLSLFKESCVDDSVLDFVVLSNAVPRVNASSQYSSTIETNLRNSLDGNYFGYILISQFQELVTNAFIYKMRACKGGNDTIC